MEFFKALGAIIIAAILVALWVGISMVSAVLGVICGGLLAVGIVAALVYGAWSSDE